MRLRELLREAQASALAARAPSLMVATLAAAMCLTTLLTVGRIAAAEAQLAGRLDEAGVRLLVVDDAAGQDLLPRSVIDGAAALDTVERAVGLTAPMDVTSYARGPGSQPVPAWTVVGELASAVTLTWGRAPGSDEAIVAESMLPILGFDAAIGALRYPDGEAAIVGAYVAREPLSQLDSGVLLGGGEGTPAASLYVTARSVRDVELTQDSVLDLIAATQASDLRVQSPLSLAELQRQVRSDVSAFGRSLLLLVLGAGAALTGVVVLTDTLIRRTDIGRRRALGATRGTVVAIVTLRTALAAVAGIVLGVASGMLLALRAESVPPWSFAVGTAVLTMLTALSASLLPAFLAARRDAVRVLRTP